jgi:hypothetical protein
MEKRTGALALVATAAIAAGAVGATHFRTTRTTMGRTRPAPGAVLAGETAELPKPERPAFVPATPVQLSKTETRARFAPVLHAATALSAPALHSGKVATLTAETPEGTTNIVEVLGDTKRGGALWVHVGLPVLPNGRTAWVPRADLGGYGFVHTHLVVDRARLHATLFYDGRRVFQAPVGVGTAESPTPAGKFYIREELSGFGDPFYGPVAFGTSARSAVLTDWPGGGFIGIHGTNAPQLIPGRISHGCIRLRNPDILRLRRLMPVGTPVTIR